MRDFPVKPKKNRAPTSKEFKGLKKMTEGMRWVKRKGTYLGLVTGIAKCSKRCGTGWSPK